MRGIGHGARGAFLGSLFLSLVLVAQPAVAAGPALDSPPAVGAPIQSVGTQITSPLPPASAGPGALLGAQAHGWLALDAAALAQAKLAAAAEARRIALAQAAAGGHFSISASPSSRTIAQGASTTYTVSTTVTSGKTQTVSLSVSGLPSGATGSFVPTSVLAGNSSTLTVATTASATPGTFALTVRGTGSTGPIHTTTVSLTITGTPPSNNFSISVSPSTRTVVQGAMTTYTVSTLVTSGVAQTVNLTVSGLPSGVAGSFSQSPITAGGSSTLTVSIGPGAALGTSTLTITGTGSSAAHATTASITVTAVTPPGPTLGSSWRGETQGGLAPPDPTGAIGPSGYIELINLRYGIFRRDGSLVEHGDLGALTGFPVSELSDPQVVWDPTAQRFYYLALDTVTDAYAFGYSTSANPGSASDFCKYNVNAFYSSSLPDYPKLAVTPDFVLVGANVFRLAAFYSGSDVDWFQKPTASTCPGSLGGGGIFANLKNADGTQTSTPEPAVNADASSAGWVVGSADVGTGSASHLSVFRVTKSGSGGAVISAATPIAVASYSMPANAPELGATQLQDTMDTRLTHAVAGYDPRIGATAIWTAHTVFGGAGAEGRWYEIGTAGTPSPSLAQSGRVTDPSLSLYVWNGAISPDRAADDATDSSAVTGRNMVMGFNTSSAATDPTLQMVSQRGTGAQSGFVFVQSSPGPNIDFSCTGGSTGNVCRWGDYAGATPDPLVSNGGQVWLSGEWNTTPTDDIQPDWQTWNWAAKP